MINNEEALEYWKLCERVTVYQATMLIVGIDPKNVRESNDVERDAKAPRGYGAAKTSLVNAAAPKLAAAVEALV